MESAGLIDIGTAPEDTVIAAAWGACEGYTGPDHYFNDAQASLLDAAREDNGSYTIIIDDEDQAYNPIETPGEETANTTYAELVALGITFNESCPE